MILQRRVPKSYLTPIKFGIAFSLLTLIIYEFGVIEYPKFNNLKLLILVIISNIAMYLGFSVGVRQKKQEVDRNDYTQSALRFYKVVCIVTLILCIPRFIIFTGKSFSISGLVSGLQNAISNPLQAYQEKHSLGSVGGVLRYVNYIIVLSGGLMWAYVPLSVLLWKKISTTYKVWFVLYATLYATQYLMVGTNTGLFNLVIEIVFSILVRGLITEDKKPRRKRKPKGKYILLIVGGVCLAVAIFNFIMESRIGDQYLNKTFHAAGVSYTSNKDHLLWKLCPEGLRSLLVNLNSYVAIGYVGLDLTLSEQLTFYPTFGGSFSRFICDNLSDLLGVDIYGYSYLGQIYEHFGFSALRSWSTMYAWWASDVSFVGIPVVMYFVMYGFGSAWRSFIKTKNVYAFLFFFLIVRFFMYISANNQVFMQYDTLNAYVFMLIAWKLSKKPRGKRGVADR